MEFSERLESFEHLGEFLKSFLQGDIEDDTAQAAMLRYAIEEAGVINPWFTEKNVHTALSSIARQLEHNHLMRWMKAYPELRTRTFQEKIIGVVTAGNIPLVGFHDLLCVVLSGHRFLGKLSSRDDKLLKALVNILIQINPGMKEKISFTEEFLRGYDAVIATGSNNSARYFEYYFRKVPNIIRRNRNGIAILSGNEPQESLRRLADDIFLYFGLGCRSVSKIYVPRQYPVKQLFEAFAGWSEVIYHHHYANNYEYNRAIYLVNQVPHLDGGYLLMKEDPGLSSPVAVLYYEFYETPETLALNLQDKSELIQCIVSDFWPYTQPVPPGKAQFPDVWEYADGVDTVRFLLQLPGK